MTEKLEKWTGDLVGKMHINRITCEELANELGTSKGYVSMLLNGRRKPEGARKRLEDAVAALIERKKV